MHQSEWGGEMWWCCGKTSKDAPGCKFGKHQASQDADNEDFVGDPDEREKEIERQKKLQKCLCCKQFGHSIE